MSEHEPANALSTRTTPTWEVELLISGVAVFAMLQLPGWLDDRMFWLAPRLDAAWTTLVQLLYVYAKSAAVILAATFVIHLLLRARWIALVGMHSVYPDGVRWDKLRMGPIQRDIEREYEVPTAVIIERADNLATTVFAIGVMLALVLVVVTAGVALVMGTATAVASTLQWEGGLQLLFVAIGMIMLLYVLALTLDRRYGARWNRDGWRARAIEALLRLFARIGMRPGKNRIRALLASHGNGSRGSERRVGMLILAIIAGTTTMVILAYNGMRDGSRFGNYGMFPAAASPALVPAHYDDRRNPERSSSAPFIDSMVASGPYLELMVPFDPRRDGPALKERCPQSGQPSNARLLDCLQSLHWVLLDGKPVAGLGYELASDSRTNRPALLAMIDIRALATGRHELRIGQAPAAGETRDGKHDESAATPADTVIPFWR